MQSIAHRHCLCPQSMSSYYVRQGSSNGATGVISRGSQSRNFNGEKINDRTRTAGIQAAHVMP